MIQENSPAICRLDIATIDLGQSCDSLHVFIALAVIETASHWLSEISAALTKCLVFRTYR